VSAWRDTSWIEIIAAVLAVAYLLLAIRQQLECWVAAFVSSCLYVWVLFTARLYMESVLNAFYAAMAVYGFGSGSKGKGGGGAAPCMPLAHRAAIWPLAGHGRTVARQFLFLAAIHPRRVALRGFHGDLVQRLRHFPGGAQGVRELALVAGDRFGQPVPVFHAHLYAHDAAVRLYLILIVIGMREWRRRVA
jgi:hypothetical protein